MAKYFGSTTQKASKTISSTPSPKAIPSTSARKPSGTSPAPLQRPCASCGRKK